MSDPTPSIERVDEEYEIAQDEVIGVIMAEHGGFYDRDAARDLAARILNQLQGDGWLVKIAECQYEGFHPCRRWAMPNTAYCSEHQINY